MGLKPKLFLQKKLYNFTEKIVQPVLERHGIKVNCSDERNEQAQIDLSSVSVCIILNVTLFRQVNRDSCE